MKKNVKIIHQPGLKKKTILKNEAAKQPIFLLEPFESFAKSP